MRRSRFRVEQIVGFLKENAAGASVRSLCRKYGFSEVIFYRWKAKYSGMEASEARRLRPVPGRSVLSTFVRPIFRGPTDRTDVELRRRG